LLSVRPIAQQPGYPGAEAVAARPPAVDVPPVYARPAIDTLATIKRRGTLRVGVATATPWVMRDKDGQLIGFSIDLAKRLAEETGVELEIVPTSWPHIIGDLLDNHFDVIASGLWVTPARAMMVNYTEPTSMGAVSLIGGRPLAASLGTVADFNKPEVSIVVNAGTEMEEVASRTFPEARLLKIDINDDPLAPVLEGKAHGAVVMSPVARVTVAASGDRLFLPTGSDLVTASAALAMRKGDPDFLNFLNAWLTYHRETGWTLERFDYWFRSTDWIKLL
ncbi:MAG: transporter substrate-binding domain-containing protein, partial [Acidobacteriota bacterium]|nr:transporter substrate-binding domain-containing protein [Acidobacteriota bacterium]